MRFWLRTVLMCVCSMCTAAALASMPSTVSITVHGDFDPGKTGGTASNSDTLSSLSIGSATVVYDNSVVSAVMMPGDSGTVSLGTITVATGDLAPVTFDGATLYLTVELTDPAAVPALALIPLDLTGQVGAGGETLTLTADPQLSEADFLASVCVAKTISLKVTPTIAVVSGDPPADIPAQLSVVYAEPFVAGDIDGDGSVTLVDAVKGLQIVGGLDQSQCDEVERGDITGSGVLDLVNVVAAARKAYGLI